RASRDFRLHVAEESAYRALCESLRRAGGAI
ncbi:MAG TPA: xanthine dehydrogenase FAD-binding subunit XdhB, partial [Candidatus Scatomorpha pullistercoris]|nr:xanthine dehydrogenase FAD-binding subunit XdhB [Candidatus Scatomorpha pullistercoris]